MGYVMTTKAATGKFWLTLSAINLIALLYPVIALVQSDNASGQFVAAFVVIAVIAILALVDAIAVAIAYTPHF